MWKILVTKTAARELVKAPQEILEAFDAWTIEVEYSGPAGLLKINGYRDHALHGEWAGARASYLNKKWRVIYWTDGTTVTVTVVRISPHDYRR